MAPPEGLRSVYEAEETEAAAQQRQAADRGERMSSSAPLPPPTESDAWKGKRHGSGSSGSSREGDDDGTREAQSVVWTTVALCVCMLTHSYLLISVFPYSGFLALHLLQKSNNSSNNTTTPVDEDGAAQYAGLIAAAFMVGRAVTSVAWGRAADRYGRTAALYASLFLSCFFSVLFGFCSSFTAAVLVRFLLGASNGIMSAIKTIVSEICGNDERTEARTMGLVVGMWGWGFLISPVVAGGLAEPVAQYPTAAWLRDGTTAGTLLRAYPFLLPNVLGAAVCLLGAGLIRVFVDETLPRSQRHDVMTDVRRAAALCQRKRAAGYSYDRIPVADYRPAGGDLSCVVEGEDEDCDDSTVSTSRSAAAASVDRSKAPPTMMSILSQKDTRDYILLHCGFSFVGLTVDEAFPLFCLSHTAGFGISEKEIGKIMSLTGLIFAVSQYFVSTWAYNSCGGLVGSIKIGAALSAPFMFLMPLSLLLNRGSYTLRWSTFFFLAILLAFHRCFSLVFFSNISVAMNRTVTAANRGAMNGLTMLGGSTAKAIGPAFAGLLTTLSASWLGRYASLLTFGTIGVLGLMVTFSTFAVLRSEVQPNADDDEEREGMLQCIELKEQRTS